MSKAQIPKPLAILAVITILASILCGAIVHTKVQSDHEQLTALWAGLGGLHMASWAFLIWVVSQHAKKQSHTYQDRFSKLQDGVANLEAKEVILRAKIAVLQELQDKKKRPFTRQDIYAAEQEMVAKGLQRANKKDRDEDGRVFGDPPRLVTIDKDGKPNTYEEDQVALLAPIRVGNTQQLGDSVPQAPSKCVTHCP